jgi:SAM-dependent methyltransferase
MSSSRYTTNAVLELTPGRVVATGGPGSNQDPIEIADRALLTVLELFVHHTDPAEAYEDFRQLTAERRELDGDDAPSPAVARPREIEIQLGPGRFLVSRPVGRNLTARSARSRRLLPEFVSARGQDGVKAATTDANGSSSTRQAFDEAFDRLIAMGLIVPAPGAVAWGDLRRQRPVDAAFGFLRGTPIDRYYLQRFIDTIRAHVTGHAVELGGTGGDLAYRGFPGVTSYSNVDLYQRPGVTIVGDVHDAALIAPASADAIVAFNVLEHCLEPWVVVENMRRWLRPGGQAFCMVPNAQRIHESPRDYWRPTPGGLGSMFRAYARHELFRYGNPASLIASYLGISAEELREDELDTMHPDYPVVTCVIAST